MQQRRELVIGLASQRVVQVERFDGLEEYSGQPACQHRRNEQRQQHNEHDPRRGRRECAERAVRRGGNTQYIAVFQPYCVIKRLFGERFGQSAVLARAVLHGLLDLRTDRVVFHLSGIHAVVIQHRAVRRDQCQTVVVDGPERRKLLPDVVHRRQIAALAHQPLAHIAREPGMDGSQQKPGRQQQRDERREKDTAENALSHVCSPMR